MKRAISLLIALSLLFALAGCGGAAAPAATEAPATEAPKDAPAAEVPAAAGEFILGCSQDLSGASALYGQECLNSVILAVEIINANGGLNGEQIKLVSYDSKASPEEAAKNANKMVDADHVDAAVLDCSSAYVFAAAPTLNEAGVICFGCGTSPSLLKDEWPYLFRCAPNSGFVMPQTVAAFQKLGITKVAFFGTQEESKLSIRDELVANCETAGIEVVAQEFYNVGDTDYTGQVAKIISADPDAVFFAQSGQDQASFLKQLRQFGYEKLAVNAEAVQTDVIRAAGDAADHVMFAFPYVTYTSIDDCDYDVMKEFLTLYSERFGGLPATFTAYETWDSMMALQEAARIAGSNDSDALVAAMHTIKDFPGLGGNFDFTIGDRDAMHDFNTFIIIDSIPVSLDGWIAEGGYEALMAEAG